MRFISAMCAGLLLWASFNDALAAQTPELDDDLVASLDNDCLPFTPVRAPTRAAEHPNYPVPPSMPGRISALTSTTPAGGPAGHSSPTADPLYLFMSLQR
jgi:hypothetical protein